MSEALFAYPAQAAFDRVIPKNKIYAYAKPARRIRDQFTSDVAQVTWKYKLAPETINLPARPGVPEIQVFTVALKPSVEVPRGPRVPGTDTAAGVFEDILRSIDRAIGFPIIFELLAADRVRTIAADKRPSEANSGKWVVGDYYATGWLPANTPRTPLPVALDLASLYEQLLRRLIPAPARPGESLQVQVERQSQIRQLEKECRKLEVRLNREKQFNRKVELNRQLRQLQGELDSLSAQSTDHPS